MRATARTTARTTPGVLLEKASLTALLIGLLMTGWVSPAQAGSGSNSMSPGVKLSGKCFTATFNSFVTIPYDPIVANLSSPATGTAILNLTCTLNTHATIDLNHGLNATPVGSYYAPNMIGAVASPDLLRYYVYSDSGYTALWGTTTSSNGGSTAGTSVAYVALSGNTTPLTLYISIPANQNVQADTYSDTVTATVAY